MADNNVALMAHLLRRAGFGATPDELEAYLRKGYEATVEELLDPRDPGNLPDDLIRRYHVEQSEVRILEAAAAYWTYRLVTTNNPLEEKIALFFHGLFATGYSKLNQAKSLLNQIDMFRKSGLGSFPALLVELSKDPAMIIWLDNNDNHNGAINENFGRELLELFAMGIGNYTEHDIKECSRAFTGWTLGNGEYMTVRAEKDSIWPYGRIAWHFHYNPEDHDSGEKTFLGETGRFNGEDVIDIIARNPATARFICTRLFQFFAADEVDESGKRVIDEMVNTYFESNFEIRAVLRSLFNSAYFKSDAAQGARVKGPVELVIGGVRMAGTYRVPTLGVEEVAKHAFYMGQGLLQPPTVEGWHEGLEWIDSGALMERVNFVAKELSDVGNPGVRALIRRLASDNGGTLTPEHAVQRCLDLLGSVRVSKKTQKVLNDHVARQGDLELGEGENRDGSEKRVGELLRLIVSTREFQMA